MSTIDDLPSTYVSGFHDVQAIRAMKYRNMPHYGLVSVISFGASGLGGMFTAGQGSGLANVKSAGNSEEDVWFMEDDIEDKERAREIVVACLKAGVNLIDSSHWYGQGRSERLLGYALAEVPRSAFFINSKIGRYEKDPLKMFDFSYEKTYQGGLDTLRRLKLDCIDSLQVHDPEFAPSVEVILEQTLPALQRLKDEGKIRLIGMTGYPLDLQQEIITRSGIAIDTSLSYCHYSLNDTSLVSSGFIDFCEQKKIALINASPISMGLLMERNPPDWHPAKPETKALCVQAVSYCKAQGVDISKLALHFTLRNESIASTLISSTSTARMLGNLRAAQDEVLSHKEEVVLAHLQEKIFGPAGTQSWEGVEIAAYWQTVGKVLITERIYTPARKAQKRATPSDGR